MQGQPRGISLKALIVVHTALHADMHTSLDRMTFPPTQSEQTGLRPADALLLSRKAMPPHRQKQIRILLSVTGKPRLPPQKVCAM